MRRAGIRATVVPGHGVASGTGRDRRFPRGTIRPQLRFFRMLPGFGARLGGRVRAGTINLRLPGVAVRPGVPAHIVAAVRWTRLFPPENFLLTPCTLYVRGRGHPAYLYIPDPATKPDHMQPSNVIELLAATVPGLRYGDAVRLAYPACALRIAPLSP